MMRQSNELDQVFVESLWDSYPYILMIQSQAKINLPIADCFSTCLFQLYEKTRQSNQSEQTKQSAWWSIAIEGVA